MKQDTLFALTLVTFDAMNKKAQAMRLGTNSTFARGTSYTAEIGKRYVKLYRVTGDSRSVCGFIDIATGDLLKAASWRGPAKGVRGNVVRGDLACVGWCSIS